MSDDGVSLQELSLEFDDLCQTRHEMGAEKYGDLSFLDRDTVKDILEELVDAANYIRYLYIKLRIIESAYNGPPTDTLGPKAFKKREFDK
jgi:hypothetical protein